MKSSSRSNPIGAGIASMTGFGRHEEVLPGQRLVVEVRTVNNRFCEIGMKLPRELNGLEGELRDRIRGSIMRGRVSVLINLERDAADEIGLDIDTEAAKSCLAKLEDLRTGLGKTEAVTLDHLLHFSEYFVRSTSPEIAEEQKEILFRAVDAALLDLKQMRRAEGIALAQDLLSRVEKIENLTGGIEKLSEGQPRAQMQKLQERLEQLISQGPLDPGRLEMEAAFLADRLDVTEECVRLRSHLQLFREAVAGDEPPGKRLGFLLQEMNREINTVSSKSALAEITHLAVEVKEEIEKMREQIQNLE
jgi:uncharacterized protein (TIGR00255 family)